MAQTTPTSGAIRAAEPYSDPTTRRWGPMESPSALAPYQVSAIRAIGFGLGVVLLPMAVVDTAQGLDQDDPYLFVAATAYALGGVGLLSTGAFAARPWARSVFLVSALGATVASLLFETPTGAARLEGLASFFLLLLGILMDDPRRRTTWIAASSVLYPAVVFLRETYRPDPMLADPFELYPQAFVGGAVVLSLGVLLHRLVGALEEQVVAARAAELAKDRFLANMSHELRTPLNAVVGYAELLAEDGMADPVAAAQDLERIREAARSLLATIDDILDLARLDGALALATREDVALEPLLAEVGAAVGPTLRRTGVRLVLPEAPGTVWAERWALRRILTNLVGNAAKFTERGEICVEVLRGPVTDELRVSDTGPGFSPELAPRLFDPFVQGDESTTRRHGGAGLGLAICARLATALGGTLHAELRPGGGAVFRLRLPRSVTR